jgi:hypothetical protein
MTYKKDSAWRITVGLLPVLLLAGIAGVLEIFGSFCIWACLKCDRLADRISDWSMIEVKDERNDR